MLTAIGIVDLVVSQVVSNQPGGRDDQLVCGFNCGVILEEVFNELFGLFFITGEQSLIETNRGADLGPLAEQVVEDAESGDIASEDDEADGHWSGEDESDRPPQCSPERRGEDNGDR